MVEIRFFHWRTFWEWKDFSARNPLEKLLHIREVNLSTHHIRCSGRLLGKLKKQLALSTRPKISVLILAFSRITGKVDNNREVYKGLLLRIFVPFDYAPGVSKIFRWTVRISEIQHSIFFWKLLHHLPPFRKYPNFWSTKSACNIKINKNNNDRSLVRS